MNITISLVYEYASAKENNDAKKQTKTEGKKKAKGETLNMHF